MTTPTRLLEAAVLDALAEPIRRHAREWAEGVCDSIGCDIQARVTRTLNEGLADVTTDGEWDSARSSVLAESAPRTGGRVGVVPQAAHAWVERVWRHAFAAGLEQARKRRVEAKRADGEETLRRHLRTAS